MDDKICLVFSPILRKTTLFFPIPRAQAPVPKRGVRALITQSYHDLHSGSYRQGQGHSLHIAKICFKTITFHE